MKQILSNQGQRRGQMPCAGLLGSTSLPLLSSFVMLDVTNLQASLPATEVSPLYQVSNLVMRGLLV